MRAIRQCFVTALAAAVAIATVTVSARAQWITGGTPVCTAPLNQQTPQVLATGNGSVIIAWEDDRDSARTGFNVYAQRLDSHGVPQWRQDGVPICTLSGDQFTVWLVTDDADGAIIIWLDTRSGTNYDIYAQRVSSAGEPMWAPNGVGVATSEENEYFTGGHSPIVSDGMGGAILAWEQRITGFDLDLYAQRLSPDGQLMWGAGGRPVSTEASFQEKPALISDGCGGAIVTWEDYRDYPNDHIYVQHLDANGSSLWATNGVLLSSPASVQQGQTIIPAGSGAFVMWVDYLDHNNTGIFCQRIDSSGVALWAAGGVPIVVVPEFTGQEAAVAGQDGSFIVVWADERTGPYQNGGSDEDIYAQKVSAEGVAQWQTNGVPICVAPYAQSFPSILADNAGGEMLVWQDDRRAKYGVVIYAQRLDASGATMWADGGIPISDTTTFAYTPVAASDGLGGALVAWADDRNGKFSFLYATNWDIYAGHLTAGGILGVGAGSNATGLELLGLEPNPTDASATVAFRLGSAANVDVDVFGIGGGRVRTLAAGARFQAGDHHVVWDGRDSFGSIVPPGVYLLRLSSRSFVSTRKLVLLR